MMDKVIYVWAQARDNKSKDDFYKLFTNLPSLKIEEVDSLPKIQEIVKEMGDLIEKSDPQDFESNRSLPYMTIYGDRDCFLLKIKTQDLDESNRLSGIDVYIKFNNIEEEKESQSILESCLKSVSGTNIYENSMNGFCETFNKFLEKTGRSSEVSINDEHESNKAIETHLTNYHKKKAIKFNNIFSNNISSKKKIIIFSVSGLIICCYFLLKKFL